MSVEHAAGMLHRLRVPPARESNLREGKQRAWRTGPPAVVDPGQRFSAIVVGPTSIAQDVAAS